MASRILRGLTRSSDEVAEGADEAAEATQRTRDIFAEAFAEQLGKTGPTAANQPAAAADAATSNIRRGLYALGGGGAAGGAAIGGAGAYRSLESRKQAEIEAEQAAESQDELRDILDDENISDDAKESALNRALQSGLFDPNLGGDPEDPDGILDNVWFRRAIALVVAYYLAKTFSDRYGG